MCNRSFWSVSALACAASAVLASCGGGELIAAVAFIGSAGGDWNADGDSTQPGQQDRELCANDVNGVGVPGTEQCRINITAANPPALYDSAFDVRYSGNLPGCPLDPTDGGRVDGKRINLPGCFAGEYVTINEAVSDSGDDRMFFDFVPSLTDGVWVEIQDERRRFAFTNSNDDGTNTTGTGCEFSAASLPAVTVVLANSNVDGPAGPFETTITSFTITGDAAGAWSGRFIGTSGMRLTRGDDVLKLERRDEVASPACP